MLTLTERLALLLLLSAVHLPAPAEDLMRPYPSPGSGQSRMVFELPPLEREKDHKLEIIVGKVMPVDCNEAWFGGSFEERVAKGWGYSYQVIEKVFGPASSMRECPPDEPKREAFVPVRGEERLLRYNSKLPVVVYVPEGFEVRYRVWAAGEEIGKARPR